MIRAGRLRHRIQLQEPTETRDAHGQAVKTYTTRATVHAAVESLRGSEAIVARQFAAEQNKLVLIRYRNDVNTDWRILHNSQALEIESISVPYGRKKNGLEIHCRETK